MSLAIDEMVRKTLDTANLADMINQVWSAQLEPLLRSREVFQQALLHFNDLLGTSGDRINIPTLPELGSGVAALTESTDMTPIQLSAATEVVLTPSEFGLTVEISRKALDRIKYDGLAEIMDRLAYQMTKKLETDISGLYHTAVPGTSSYFTSIYPNAHDSSSVVAGDVLDDATLMKALTTLQAADVPAFDDGHYMLFVTPSQFNQMIVDDDIRQDLRYASPSASLLNNELAVYHSLRIIVSNFVNSGTEHTSVAVTRALLLAPRAVAVAWKRKPELVVDPTVYDLGRRRRFGITADYKIAVLHADRGVAITTAS